MGQAVGGEGRVLIEVFADVLAPALNEMLGQVGAAFRRLQVDVFQSWVEQGDEVAETGFLAAVGSGGDQNQVPLRVFGQTFE